MALVCIRSTSISTAWRRQREAWSSAGKPSARWVPRGGQPGPTCTSALSSAARGWTPPTCSPFPSRTERTVPERRGQDVAAAPLPGLVAVKAHRARLEELQRDGQGAEQRIPSILDGLELAPRHPGPRPGLDERGPGRVRSRDIAPADGLGAALHEWPQAFNCPAARVGELPLLVFEDCHPAGSIERKEAHLEGIGVDLAQGGMGAARREAGPEGFEPIGANEPSGEQAESRGAGRTVRRGVKAPEPARDLIVAAAAAAAIEPEQGRVDAHGGAVMGDVAGDPVEHGVVARQGLRDLAEVKGKALAPEQS